ncbi:MAG: Pr6Pr family membrane protein [Jiangellales bacterium]
MTRGVLAATAGLALLSVAGQYPVSLAEGTRGFVFETIEYFSYFTIVSNLLLAAGAALMAVDPRRSESWLAALRLAGLVMITVTGIVYHLLLRSDEFAGLGYYTDLGLHTVVPIMAVLGWLAVGPHRLLDWSILVRAMLLPVGWLAYALVRAEVVGEALYPFMDVAELGIGEVALTVAAITAFALALGAAYIVGDRWLPAPAWASSTSEAEAARPAGASRAP